MNRMFAAIIIITFASPSVSLAYSGGSGEPNNPYQIATKADLLELAYTAEDYNKCFVLTADINVQNQVFTDAIIGTAEFTGTFDGNNLKVTNFTIDGGINFDLGLFGRIASVGSIKNLGIENFTVSGTDRIGGLVGNNSSSGSITNCHSTGSVNGDSSVGGLVGNNDGCNIINCYSTGDVNGTEIVGGLVGCNQGSITNCYSTGTVSGAWYYSLNVGGLVGFNQGNIANCRSTAAVSCPSNSDCVGGLVGENEDRIINSYSTGTVSGTYVIGGLVGGNLYGSITNCYSMATVSGTAAVGGLVGNNDYISCISNCYSTGTVSGDSNVGGLVGYNAFSSSSVIKSYFLLGAGPDNGFGTPLTDEQMKQQANFYGWDFLNESANGTCSFWQMPLDSYPALSVFCGYIPPELNGSGTEHEPYIITDANDLGTVWYRPSAHYILANDINLAPIQWSAAVVPVFSGVFDGNNFSISNLSVNGGAYLALFGESFSSSQIKNLDLEDCSVIATGENVGGLVGKNDGGNVINCRSTVTISGLSPRSVGGLVGCNNGSIFNCFSMGSVSGSECRNIGGLVGYNPARGYYDYLSSIVNCYSTCAVIGENNVGGLVGVNSGSIGNCYSIGAVSGDSDVGGLAGRNSGNISNSYFLVNSGPDNGYGIPLTDTQMKQQISFNGWDFLGETANGTCSYWQMPEYSYPVISILNGYIPPELSGSGTEHDPYIIADANDLGNVWYRPSAHYILANDINLAPIQWSAAVVPVFCGVFDGDGLSINNIVINGGGYLGLFGISRPGSQIKNLDLKDCTVIGTDSYVGTLVGSNRGNITNSYLTGTVNGNWNTGGLVGGNLAKMINCHATANVNGSSNVGGLVGYNCHYNISNCSSAGSVHGNRNIGGLVGYIDTGSIIACCSTCTVSGNSYLGGLVGRNLISSNITDCYSIGTVSGIDDFIGGLLGMGGNVSNSYSAGNVSGDSHVGGLLGYCFNNINSCYFLITSGPDNGNGTPLTDAQMKQQTSFIDWDFVAETANGSDDIWRMCVDGIYYPLLWWQFNPADFTCPDGVDFIDYAVLADAWLTDPAQDNWNPRCDIAIPPDKTIDVLDLAAFTQNWLLQE